MGVEVLLQRLEVGLCAFAGHKSKLHQPACRIVDEDKERARLFASALSLVAP
jgi:hypothetical protein